MVDCQVYLSDKLVAQLRRKGMRYLLLDVAFSKSCGGAVGELFARAIKDAEARRVLEDASARCLPCLDAQGGEVCVDGNAIELLVANARIVLEPEAHLDTRPLLGLADLRIDGARY